jgi:thiamine biosynthesis lipoprotein
LGLSRTAALRLVPTLLSVLFSVLLTVLFSAPLSGCLFADVPSLLDADTPRERAVVSDGWLAMGTFFEADLRVAPGDEPRARAWLEWARTEIARLEAVYSRHDSTSELSQLNRLLLEPDVLSRELQISLELERSLFYAIEVWEGTGGAFDPTVGPLLSVWRSAVEAETWPSLGQLRAAKRRVGSQSLLMPGDGVLSVTTHGLQIDLDGLSKGIVLERLQSRFAEQFPQAAALISFGESSVLALGDPDGRRSGGGWKLEVHSRGADPIRLATIRLRDQALSVSSSLGRVAVIDGQRVSHVVDPRTGVAVEGAVEAVVVSARAGVADGWSTGLLVLGAQRESMRLIERGELEAYVLEEGDRVASTGGWETLELPVPTTGTEVAN